ncbi:phosphorylase family protein [Solidesulfovibrio sp.]
MLKILIVEDDTIKLHNILSVILNFKQITINDITHVTNSYDARNMLSNRRFDLMIFDIAIPDRIDLDISKDGGFRLIQDTINRDKFNTPPHIIGITQYEELKLKINEYFPVGTINLLQYENNTDSFAQPLKFHIEHILKSLSNSFVDIEFKYDLAILCALKSPEFEKLLNVGWKWKPYKYQNDASQYYIANITTKKGVKKVVATHAQRMGMVSSSIQATKMIEYFRPQYLCMTGIMASVDDDISLGDIIASDVVWDWGSGKWAAVDGQDIFLSEPYQQQINIDTRNKLIQFSNSDCFNKIYSTYAAKKPDTVLKFHMGPTATGSSVVSNKRIRDSIASQHRKVIGVDMEIFSIFEAAYQASKPQPSVVTFKSVVDYADSLKDNSTHHYSSYTSAMAMRLFFENAVWS